MGKFSGKDIYASWCSCPSQALFTSTRGLSVLSARSKGKQWGNIWVADVCYQGKTCDAFHVVPFSYCLVNSSLQERVETISAALQGHMDDEEAEEEPSSPVALTFLKSWHGQTLGFLETAWTENG